MHFSEHLANCFELAVYFSFLQPTVFINRDCFGNEGYITAEICLMPGGACRLRRSGVVRLQAWEAGCLGFNLLLSSSVTSVRHINSLSLNAFIGKVKLMRRVVRIQGVHNCLGSHLASADQGWFLQVERGLALVKFSLKAIVAFNQGIPSDVFQKELDT